MEEYNLDSTWRIINAISVELIDKEKFDEIRKDNFDKQRKYIDLNLDKKDWLEQIWYIYINTELANIFWKHKKEIDNIVYYWEQNSNLSKTQKINKWWDKFINFSNELDKKASFIDNQPHNLCWYITTIFHELNKILNELDILFKEITKIINFSFNRFDNKNLDWKSIHSLRIQYNMFIGNVLAVYEYLDLFIVIENLYFEKSIFWKKLKNKKIQLQVSREQRLKPYFIQNNLTNYLKLFEEYKKERDFLLHKWNIDFRFLQDKDKNIFIKIKNTFLIDKIKNDYNNIENLLNSFFENYKIKIAEKS